MSRFSLALAGLTSLVVFGLFWTTMNQADDSAANSQPPERLLRHVVCFKFRAEASAEEIQGVVDEFALLPSKIDAIHDFEWGINNSQEGHDKGFTHCFLVTFRDEAGRDEYLPHEAHQAFVSIVLPVIEDVFVIDYWTPAP